VTTAALTWLSSAAALPLLRNALPGSPASPDAATALVQLPWHKSLKDRADALLRELAAADPDELAAAVGREVRRRLDELETGLRRYRKHDFRRETELPRAVWRDGTTLLRDYAGIEGAPEDGMPLLVVPSLVNRSYILDLTPERSLLRFLCRRRFRPFLVDWDRPGPRERRFDLGDYVVDRLGSALDRVIDRTGRKPALLGYCMGGNLALGLALARPRDVSALALLATPWDFHAERADLARATAHALTPWMPMFEALGEMPVDVLQSLFFALDPFLGARKFRGFASVDPDSAKAREFVALEDWLNDGVGLAAGVARECVLGWYGENTPARGEWRLRGMPVRPEKIAVPSFVVIPAQDRIVPPASALALARALPSATLHSPPLGHIGMVVGGQATAALWEPLARWLDLPSNQRL
jgi:polyhydroxyalkanoate synthase